MPEDRANLPPKIIKVEIRAGVPRNEVQKLIAEKLAQEPTDVFKSYSPVVIVVERPGY